jgi:hypothetical protein
VRLNSTLLKLQKGADVILTRIKREVRALATAEKKMQAITRTEPYEHDFAGAIEALLVEERVPTDGLETLQPSKRRKKFRQDSEYYNVEDDFDAHSFEGTPSPNFDENRNHRPSTGSSKSSRHRSSPRPGRKRKRTSLPPQELAVPDPAPGPNAIDSEELLPLLSQQSEDSDSTPRDPENSSSSLSEPPGDSGAGSDVPSPF